MSDKPLFDKPSGSGSNKDAPELRRQIAELEAECASLREKLSMVQQQRDSFSTALLTYVRNEPGAQAHVEHLEEYVTTKWESCVSLDEILKGLQ